MKVLVMGPAHPLRGGLASFDHRLTRAFQDQGDEAQIISFSLQYPDFLFPGTTQYTDEPPPEGITIHTWINSINPINWLLTARRIRKLQPDLVVVRFWLPLMGPALGTILRRLDRKRTRVVCIADNVIPHEKRPGDKPFTAYFLKACDGFITMSEKVMKDLRKFRPQAPAKQVLHPLYDNFGYAIPKDEARRILGLSPTDKIVLFFGFIRKYKGLDILLEAMKDERLHDVKLLVAGEFYEDEAPYRELMKDPVLQERVILRTQFIPDSEVARYLCAADVVIQPYRNATQSGVTPLAYHFEKPMIVTRVGGLPDLVPEGSVGLHADPEPASLVESILKFYEIGEAHFLPGLREEKKKYSWDKLVEAIRSVAF